MAAAASLGAILAGSATFHVMSPSAEDDWQQSILASHLRATLSGHTIDVASSDRHTVKPWFNAHIPQSPRVVDLAKDDFPLVGGRIDVVGRTPVPTLVYRRARHLISVTAIPASGRADASPVRRAADGFNMLHWIENGTSYWAVSDVAATDLDAFAKAFRAAEPER